MACRSYSHLYLLSYKTDTQLVMIILLFLNMIIFVPPPAFFCFLRIYIYFVYVQIHFGEKHGGQEDFFVCLFVCLFYGAAKRLCAAVRRRRREEEQVKVTLKLRQTRRINDLVYLCYLNIGPANFHLWPYRPHIYVYIPLCPAAIHISRSNLDRIRPQLTKKTTHPNLFSSTPSCCQENNVFKVTIIIIFQKLCHFAWGKKKGGQTTDITKQNKDTTCRFFVI